LEAALHSLYLCLKVPTTVGVIPGHGCQKDARNIEQGFAPGHRNVNCLQDEKIENCGSITRNESEGTYGSRPIEPECKTRSVPLDPRLPNKIVMISQDLTSNEETELLPFLDKNNDVFTWRTFDLTRVSRDIIEHKLQVSHSAKPKKQKLCKMSDEKVAASKVVVQRLLDTGFICEVHYPSWLAIVVMVKKNNGKCRMFIDFTYLNKCCPKDNFL
jgi:hypothetical protein